ncbi:hypothetical protein [Streptomyces sp. NPDC059071]|uniref:hypothetical protein n=1 Tax=unclassified Streptomyces TaxID=2593676 RepID=UPI00365486C1
MPQLDTEAEVRNFLALCLKTRTTQKLAQVMPDLLRTAVEKHAPHLTELRTTADQLDADATAARHAHHAALERWINDHHTASAPAV